MSSINASMINCTLSSSSWKVSSEVALEKCLVFGDPDDCSSLQDLVSLDNCILLERRKDDEDEDDRPSCQFTVSLKEGEEDKWRFSGFSLLTSAKYVELHGKQSREYIASLKGQLVDMVDDMVMIQFDHRLYPRPESFHLTLIPKEPLTEKIWIYGLLLKVSKYLGAPLAQASSSDSREKKDTSNDFFINMMCQMMSKKMDIRKK